MAKKLTLGPIEFLVRQEAARPEVGEPLETADPAVITTCGPPDGGCAGSAKHRDGAVRAHRPAADGRMSRRRAFGLGGGHGERR
jgi:hypothetical protein